MTLILLLGVVVLPGLLFPLSGNRYGNAAQRTQAKSDETQIIAALNGWSAEYGAPLKGSDVAILRALQGENPRRICFLSPRPARDPKTPKDGFANGRLYDPWGSPYRFDLRDPANPKVWSPGKNKKDEPDDPHSDDICSWR